MAGRQRARDALARIVQGSALAEVRATIHDTVWLPKVSPAGPRTGTPPKGSRMTTSAPTETRARVNLPRRVPAELRAGHRYNRVARRAAIRSPSCVDPTEPKPRKNASEEEDPEEPGYGEPTPAECPQSCFRRRPPGLPADSAGVPAKLRAVQL